MGKANARPYGAMWLLADALMSWTWDPPRSYRCQSLLLDDRLLSMAGLYGVRDELTRYARPLTGAYYFIPSAEDVLAFATSAA